MSSNFYKYFKQNMDGLNLDCPDTRFSSSNKALSSATTILSLIKQLEKRSPCAN
jgi:hypothetical protein